MCALCSGVSTAGQHAIAALWDAPLAPLAQLDRALPSEGRGQRFESSRVRQSFSPRPKSVPWALTSDRSRYIHFTNFSSRRLAKTKFNRGRSFAFLGEFIPLSDENQMKKGLYLNDGTPWTTHGQRKNVSAI